MSRASKKPRNCIYWLNGPHLSDTNAKYGVGGDVWKELYTQCMSDFSTKYPNIDEFYLPKNLYTLLKETAGTDKEKQTQKNILEKIQKILKKTEDLNDILMIHAVFILTYGLLRGEVSAIDRKTKPVTDRSSLVLRDWYTIFYEYASTFLKDRTSIKDILVDPNIFLDLDKQHTPRIINLKTIYDDEALELKFPLKNTPPPHPISKKQRLCKVNKLSTCTDRFKNITNRTFKPLADVITCYCSFFKQKLNKVEGNPQMVTLVDTGMVSSYLGSSYRAAMDLTTLTPGDYSFIKHTYARQEPRHHSIAINKPSLETPVPTEGTPQPVCIKKHYLSQMFSKVCSLLYTPVQVTPKSDSIEDIQQAAKTNVELGKYYATGYCYGKLNVFDTSIDPYSVNSNPMTNVPVYFIQNKDQLYYDPYRGPTIEFFTDLMKELVELKVFIPSTTLYNNERYILNLDFDIETLECYHRLPKEVRTPALKEAVTQYFFLFIGNLLHFAVANNIELPFKLSRIYIMKLFDLYDLSNIEQMFESLSLKLLLISIYLLEKAPASFTNTIIDIFENPEILVLSPELDPKNPKHVDILKDPIAIRKYNETRAKAESIIELLNVSLDDPTDKVMMNGYYTLVVDDHPIYSENETTLFENMIEYLYKIALKQYFHKDTQDIPVTDTFMMHPYLQKFFKGFRSTKEYHTKDDDKYYTLLKTFSFNKLTDEYKLAAIRKLDLYLSGFGITYQTILHSLVPKIVIHTDSGYNNIFMGKTLPSIPTSLQDPDPSDMKHIDINNSYIRETWWLGRILLNRGRDISPLFIKTYNHKFYNIPIPEDDKDITYYGNMKPEDYHNEFVKILLKTWGGAPTISSSNYKVIFYANNLLPKTQTCFLELRLQKPYKSPMELYNDLVMLVVGTNFGESLSGGSTKNKRSSKHKK